jgi:hypothetical protein
MTENIFETEAQNQIGESSQLIFAADWKQKSFIDTCDLEVRYFFAVLACYEHILLPENSMRFQRSIQVNRL